MRILLAVTMLLLAAFPVAAGDELIVKQSAQSVAATLDKLERLLGEKSIKVFGRIDHAAGARTAGLELKPTQLLIFGNPQLGTPLMQAERKIGLDLPMKVLAWEDETGKVWIAYTSPDELKDRFDIDGRDAVFQKMSAALDNLTNAATAKD